MTKLKKLKNNNGNDGYDSSRIKTPTAIRPTLPTDMKKNKLTTTEIENLISPEIDQMSKNYEREREILDRIKAIPAGEDYIRLRYPVYFTFSRADLQELAIKNIRRLLTEKEMEQLEDALVDMNEGKAFEELTIAIIDSICEVTEEERDEECYVL